MVEITISRSIADRSIRGFSVEGHADYAESGKDIVCAGVSAVTVGTVNAIESLTGVELDSQMNSGLLHVLVPLEMKADVNDKVQLLLESMVVMLQSIEESYGTYITMQEENIQ